MNDESHMEPVGRFVEGDRMLNGKHILIENCPGMGDLIMCTPAFKRLKELYPDCVLNVVSYTHNLDIIAGLPYIDHVYGITKGKFLGHFRPALHFREQDYVIFTSWQPQLARMAQILRVPHRAGVCKEKYRGTGLFHQDLPMHDFRDTKYRADFITEQISLALGVDLSNDGVCEVAQPDEESRKKIELLLGAKGFNMKKQYAVIAPFAKTERSIPESLLLETIRYITNACGLLCIIIHSQKTPVIKKCTSLANVYDLSGETDIQGMSAVLSGAAFTVAVDSGPMHVSAALGTPTISIFSSGNHRAWNPRRNCSLVTLDKACSPCNRETAELCSNKDCINNISLDILKPYIEKIMHN